MSGRPTHGIGCAHVLARLEEAIDYSLTGASGGADDKNGWFLRGHSV